MMTSDEMEQIAKLADALVKRGNKEAGAQGAILYALLASARTGTSAPLAMMTLPFMVRMSAAVERAERAAQLSTVKTKEQRTS
jgi:hypothetical protein